MKESTPCVFLSWSGERSKKVAEEFQNLFKDVFDPVIDCFLSTRNIAPGARSLQILFDSLEKCNYGISFIDSENARAPWIQFEAGALSKMGEDSKVMILLLDNNTESLQGTPFSEFQYKLFNKEHIESIFDEIIKLCGQVSSRDTFLKRFENGWDLFFKNSNKILANVQNEIDMHNKEKDELNTIKKMLVDIQNLLKGDYGQNIRESIGLVNELKRVMLNMTPDNINDMKMRFKVQRYRMAFDQNIQGIEELIDNIESEGEYSTEKIIEKLNSIIGGSMSLLED